MVVCLKDGGRFERWRWVRKKAVGLKREGGRFEKSSVANCEYEGEIYFGGGKCGLRGLRKR